MNNSLPGTESHNSSSKTLQDPFYSVLMANAILNICLCYPTIMMNILAIQALRKTPSLSKNLKTLLLNLAVSDLSVGVLGQPLYIVRRVGQLHGNLHKLRTSFSIVANVLFLSSFCGVTAASADRFVSIWKPLRYPQLVTHERVVITVIAIWLLKCISWTCECVPSHREDVFCDIFHNRIILLRFHHMVYFKGLFNDQTSKLTNSG